jgi:hypothetical protein
MTIAERLACAAFAALLPVAAAAQNAEVQFWLKGDPKNIQGCIAADPSFTREHTFLLVNGQAEIKSAGGINVKLKPVRADVYTGDFDLGRMNLDIVADLSTTPKTLTVVNQSLGCKWAAQRE